MGRAQVGAATMIGEAQEEDLGERRLLRIMDPELGDSRHTWDPKNDDEVAIAHDLFKGAQKKGLCAFRVNKDGSQAAVMKDFDPEAKAIIFTPLVKGG